MCVRRRGVAGESDGAWTDVQRGRSSLRARWGIIERSVAWRTLLVPLGLFALLGIAISASLGESVDRLNVLAMYDRIFAMEDRWRHDRGRQVAAAEQFMPSAKRQPHEPRSVVRAADNVADLYMISLGATDGLQPGTEFELWRGPQEVGTVLVDRVYPEYSFALRKPGSAAFAAEAGDVCLPPRTGR